MKHERIGRTRSIQPALFPWIRGTAMLVIGRRSEQRSLRLALDVAERMLAAFIRALEADVSDDALLVAGIWFSREEIEDAIGALVAETVRGPGAAGAALADTALTGAV